MYELVIRKILEIHPIAELEIDPESQSTTEYIGHLMEAMNDLQEYEWKTDIDLEKLGAVRRDLFAFERGGSVIIRGRSAPKKVIRIGPEADSR